MEANLEREIETAIFDLPIATEIRPARAFYPAEVYHHQYYRKNPLNYKQYLVGCGRRPRLKELWGGE